MFSKYQIIQSKKIILKAGFKSGSLLELVTSLPLIFTFKNNLFILLLFLPLMYLSTNCQNYA